MCVVDAREQRGARGEVPGERRTERPEQLGGGHGMGERFPALLVGPKHGARERQARHEHQQQHARPPRDLPRARVAAPREDVHEVRHDTHEHDAGGPVVQRAHPGTQRRLGHRVNHARVRAERVRVVVLVEPDPRGREHAEPEEGEPPEHVRQAVRRGRNAVLQYVQREPPAHAHCGLHGRCDGPAARVTTGSRQRLGPIHVRFSWSFLELTAGRAPRPGRPPVRPNLDGWPARCNHTRRPGANRRGRRCRRPRTTAPWGARSALVSRDADASADRRRSGSGPAAPGAPSRR